MSKSEIGVDPDNEDEIFMNKILPEARFAKRGTQEYHVFSMKTEDPNTIESWLQIAKPLPVLIDPETYEDIKGKRMNWVFDKEKSLIGLTLKN
tara:strand:+ start:80 stop:358 length:279 start_codon:yes stop_codon:yes gene_type:complete